MRHALALLVLVAAATTHAEPPVDLCNWQAPPTLFTQDPETGVRLHHWIGALHEHSSLSDGFPGTTARDYYQSGASHCLDFMAGSEHSDPQEKTGKVKPECVSVLNAQQQVSRIKREACLRIQETALRTQWDAHQVQAGNPDTDRTITGIRGFEWTNDEHNHIGVYFSTHQRRARADGRSSDMNSFWEWLTTPVEQQGGSDALGIFNHPASALFGETRRSLRTDQPGFNPHRYDGTDNWNHYRLQMKAVQQMVGVEVFNSLEGGEQEFLPGYHGLLDNGWYVGAVAGEDEHGTNWGSTCLPKTVLIARDAGHAQLRRAMEQRRMYALAGHNCNGTTAGPGAQAMRMVFRLLGPGIPQPMGSRITADRQTVILQGRIYWDEAGDYRLELVSNGGEVIASVDNMPLLERAVEVRSREHWYYLRAVRINNEAPAAEQGAADSQPAGSQTPELLAVSSPIWLQAPDPVETVQTGNSWLERGFMNIALRGGELEAPEHTLYAYRKALQGGANALHVELRVSSDGQFVALRDAELKRTTDGDGLVSERSLAELQGLDAAYWFTAGADSGDEKYPLRGVAGGHNPPPDGYTENDFRIPSIDEILQVFPDTPLLIELKSEPLQKQGQEAQLARTLRDAGRSDDVMLLTFLSPQLQLYRAVAPTLSSAIPGADIAAFLAPGPAGRPGIARGHQGILLSADRLLQSPAIERARGEGLASFAWRVGNCKQIRQLLAAGVNGIASPQPAALATLLKQPEGTECTDR